MEEVSEFQENKEKITKEFCKDKTLIFFPEDEKEAMHIQKRLFNMGYAWNAGDYEEAFNIFNPAACVDNGIVLSKGELFDGLTSEDYLDGIICTAEQLADDYVGPAEIAENKGKGVDDEEILKAARQEIDNMIGLNQAKLDMQQNIALARLNQAKEEMGLTVKPISLHMVFTGNPGTGKTTFAREIAKMYYAMGLIDRPEVIEVTRDKVVGDKIGQTAKLMTAQIEKAQGGILFIDEAYIFITRFKNRQKGLW